MELVHEETDKYIESYTHDGAWEEAHGRLERRQVLDVLVAVCFRRQRIGKILASYQRVGTVSFADQEKDMLTRG